MQTDSALIPSDALIDLKRWVLNNKLRRQLELDQRRNSFHFVLATDTHSHTSQYPAAINESLPEFGKCFIWILNALKIHISFYIKIFLSKTNGQGSFGRCETKLSIYRFKILR